MCCRSASSDCSAAVLTNALKLPDTHLRCSATVTAVLTGAQLWPAFLSIWCCLMCLCCFVAFAYVLTCVQLRVLHTMWNEKHRSAEIFTGVHAFLQLWGSPVGADDRGPAEESTATSCQVRSRLARMADV